MSEDNEFARKLNKLFDKIRKPNGKPYSNQEVANALGGGTTAGHIWKLRNGNVKNPKYFMIKALIDFFKVPPGYFFCDEEEEQEIDLEILQLAQKLDDDPDAREIAMRASGGLKRDTERKIVLSMIDAIEKINEEEEARLRAMGQKPDDDDPTSDES